MSDHGHDYADGQLAAFEAEVADVYRKAEQQARKDLDAFLDEFRERDDDKRAELEAGQISERAYADWRKGMMMTGRRYQQVLDQVAEAYSHANEVAVAALNGRLPDVYAENANYGGWQVCEASGLDVSFSLMDASTAQHMLTAGEALIAPPALNVAKDLAWNRKLLASQLTQGVLLGESIPKLTKRVQRVTGSNYAAAVRTARTAVTGAENAGRVHSYGLARAMGIKMQKEWLATLDGRTRHTHRKLDKAKAPDTGTFENGCRFPGDPQGPYSEICNCRCTLVAAVDGIDQDGAERWSRLPPGMTYEQWKAGGSGRKAAETGENAAKAFKDGISAQKLEDVRGMGERQLAKATDAQKQAIFNYTSTDFGIMNAYLRGLSNKPSDSIMKSLEGIDDFMASARTSRTVYCVRQLDGSENLSTLLDEVGRVEAEKNPKLLIGKRITENGFSSTSVDEGGYNDEYGPFGGSVTMNIVVPKGSRAAYIAGLSDFEPEHELLIDRDSTFKVRNAEFSEGKWVLWLKLIRKEGSR